MFATEESDLLALLPPQLTTSVAAANSSWSRGAKNTSQGTYSKRSRPDVEEPVSGVHAPVLSAPIVAAPKVERVLIHATVIREPGQDSQVILESVSSQTSRGGRGGGRGGGCGRGRGRDGPGGRYKNQKPSQQEDVSESDNAPALIAQADITDSQIDLSLSARRSSFKIPCEIICEKWKEQELTQNSMW